MSLTPIFVLTGFLGSGKTTWLNAALRSPGFDRTVVIVNEFGDVGIDHELIATSDDAIVLLENGCLCCAVKGDLLQTLDRLWQQRLQGNIGCFDRVIIETSGLAEPSPIIEALLSEAWLTTRYTLAGVVTVVDAVNGQATLDQHAESVKQVALADHLLITKTDLALAAPEQLGVLTDRLRAINPQAALSVAGPMVDVSRLFVQRTTEDVLVASSAFAGASPLVASGHHHQGGRIHRFSVLREAPLALSTVELFLKALADNAGERLLRVKGFFNVADEPERPAVIHGAQRIVHRLEWLDQWPSADRRTRLVFITCDMPEEELSDLLGYIEGVAERTRRAREQGRLGA